MDGMQAYSDVKCTAEHLELGTQPATVASAANVWS